MQQAFLFRDRVKAALVSVPLRGKYRGELQIDICPSSVHSAVSVPLRGKYRGEFWAVGDLQRVSKKVSVPLRGKYRGESNR